MEPRLRRLAIQYSALFAVFACWKSNALLDLSRPYFIEDGANFDTNGVLHNGQYFLPADPDGAVGLRHVVDVGNSFIEWWLKDPPTLQSQQALGTPSGFLPASIRLFDPKVVYDCFVPGGRFVVIALERQDEARGQTQDVSRIHFAVTRTADPNDGWWTYVTDVAASVGTINGVPVWADYPSLSVDEVAVYVSVNMFTFGLTPTFQGVRVFALFKDDFYFGSTQPRLNVVDPYPAGFPGVAATTTLANLCSGQVAHPPPFDNPGTFMMSYQCVDGSPTLSAFRIITATQGGEFPNTTFVQGAGPFFTSNITDVVGDNGDTCGPLVNAPQLGGAAPLDVDTRPRQTQAVWQDDTLYAVSIIRPRSSENAGQTTVYFWELATDSNGVVQDVLSQGEIGGEDFAPGSFTFYPSLTINTVGDLGIGFSISGPLIYPSAAFVTRPATSVTFSPTVVFAEGLDSYVRTGRAPDPDGTINGRNRWGDYNSAVVDPSDGQGICLFNMYALTRGTEINQETGRWGTRWTCYPPARAPVLTCPETHSAAGCLTAATSNLVAEGSLWKGNMKLIMGNTQGAYGDPINTDVDYVICVYGGDRLVDSVLVEGGSSLWSKVTTGYQYQNPTPPVPGVSQLVLKEGTDGTGYIIINGAKSGLTSLSAALFGSRVSYLQVRASGSQSAINCFDSTTMRPTLNTQAKYVAKNP
eukprot:jgi/Mesvir1/17588/Mv08821-RA.1